MTKEELEKEADKALDKRMGTICYIKRVNVQIPYTDGYKDGVESREKHIEELEKENAELKAFRQDCVKLTEDNVVMARQRAEKADQLTKAKEIIQIAIEGIKHWGIVGGTERPFEKQAELEFNLFLEKAEDFIK